jgi:hypothetical protein
VRNHEARSWFSTVNLLIALAFLCSAPLVLSGERAWWVLTIAIVSGLLLVLGVGYVAVRGVWWVMVALVAKMVCDVKKRIEEAPWQITEKRREYVRSERFAQQLAVELDGYQRRRFNWWRPFKPRRLKLSPDDLETVVALAIGWGLSGHDLGRTPGVFRIRHLAEFVLQHEDEVKSILPQIIASVRTLTE